MMFGYASDETRVDACAHHLGARAPQAACRAAAVGRRELAPARREEPGLGSLRGRRATEITGLVLSTQHAPDVSAKTIREFVLDELVPQTLPADRLPADWKDRAWVNPSGSFVEGGPATDTGLTGRKIIVDTYGGAARHGGGAFSGKDPSKVDRSAAYAARWAAKNVVAAGLARRCEVCLAYAIGVAEPVAIAVETFGTATTDEAAIRHWLREHFDLTPRGIIEARPAATDLRAHVRLRPLRP